MHEIVDGHREGSKPGSPEEPGLYPGPQPQHAPRDGPAVDLIHHVGLPSVSLYDTLRP